MPEILNLTFGGRCDNVKSENNNVIIAETAIDAAGIMA